MHSAAPPADAEERYQKILVWNAKSKIWGTVPIPMKQSKWLSGSYNTLFDPSTGTRKILSSCFFNNVLTDYGNASGGMPTGTVWLMPDDPLPKDSYGPAGSLINRQVKLTLVVDVHSYTTWQPCVSTDGCLIAPYTMYCLSFYLC